MRTKDVFKELCDVPEGRDESLRRFSSIVDPMTGIINAFLRRREYEKYGLRAYQCLSANTAVLTNASRRATSGGFGVAPSGSDALRSCISEAVERYCLAFSQVHSMRECRFRDLPKDERSSEIFVHTDQQYRQHSEFAHPRYARLEWVQLRSISESKRLWWPASLLFIPFEKGKPCAETTSTGTAAHERISDALLSGVLEIIERDALMLNTRTEIPPFRIHLETLSPVLKKLVARISRRFQVAVFRLQSDIDLPIYLTLVWTGEGIATHYGIGAAARLNSDEAISKALQESVFTYQYSRDMGDLRVADAKRIRALYEHFLYYQQENFVRLPYWKAPSASYYAQLVTRRSLLAQLERLGHRPYFVELTTSDVRRTGIRVVRVVIPGMLDLEKVHGFLRERASRYESVPRALGYSSGCVWRDPHPFP